jgi:hypothetical protein
MLGQAMLVVGLLTSLAGCCAITPYAGDGTLAYVRGPHAYELTLAEVRLSERQTYSYTLKGLPNEWFVLGLQVRAVGSKEVDWRKRPPINASISLRVTNERDELVVAEEGDLSKWEWINDAILHRRGRTLETPYGTDGSVTVRAIDYRPDGGWGTAFTPRCNGTYHVELVIVDPDPNATNFRVTLVATGGPRGSL